MISLNEQKIPMFQSDMIKTPHGFTCRLGGVSTLAEYKSLNLGLRTDDDEENVRENYKIAKESLGIEELVLAKQEHTDVVMAVDRTNAGKVFPQAVDGLVTDIKNLALGVFTADCTPVLMYDPEKSVIAAVHSGWRGTVQKISQKAVLLMAEKYGCDPKDIRCAIGPSIGKCCFEIGEDAALEFKKVFGGVFDKYATSKGEKFMADNAGLVEHTLREAGVLHIDRSSECTYCRNHTFFSHRKGDKGRQCGFIMMK